MIMSDMTMERQPKKHSQEYMHNMRVFYEKILPRIILCILSFICILPYYFMVISSIKTTAELRANPPTWIPHSFEWKNYILAMQYIPFPMYFKNTLILTVANIIGAILSNSLVGYGIAKIRWPGAKIVFIVAIATMLIPFPVVLVALFDIFAKLKMINTYWPLILPSFIGSGTSIFMMRQYLMGIPMEISDAGFIDGANEFQIFWILILPLMKPVIAVIGIFAALGAWNDFMGPLIYLSKGNLYPLSIGLQFFRSEHNVEFSLLMAASAIVALPVVVIFLFFQRFFVEGITMGSIKG
jgi:multiple sugar transport system permease protein